MLVLLCLFSQLGILQSTTTTDFGACFYRLRVKKISSAKKVMRAGDVLCLQHKIASFNQQIKLLYDHCYYQSGYFIALHITTWKLSFAGENFFCLWETFQTSRLEMPKGYYRYLICNQIPKNPYRILYCHWVSCMWQFMRISLILVRYTIYNSQKVALLLWLLNVEY